MDHHPWKVALFVGECSTQDHTYSTGPIWGRHFKPNVGIWNTPSQDQSDSIHEPVRHSNACFLVSCNRCKASPSCCQVWTQVFHSVREKKETQNFFQGDGSTLFFCKEQFIYQNWDRQPGFKLYKNIDVLCIYCMIPSNMHLDVERVHECYQIGPAKVYFKCRPQIGPVLYVWSCVEHSPFFLDTDFLMKKITNLTSNFTWREVCSLSNKCYQECWVSVVSILGFGIGLTDTCDTGLLQVLISFDRHTFHLIACEVWRWGCSPLFWKTGQLVINIYD
jgi:hypothetical protein